MAPGSVGDERESAARLGEAEEALALLPGGGGGKRARPGADLRGLVAEHRRAGRLVWLAQGAVLLWFATSVGVALSSWSGLFSFHPLLQSVAALLFYQAIVVLQPTRAAAEKRAGLLVHQAGQIAGLLALLAGSTAIYYNKTLHGAPHLTSWHGVFGALTILVVVLQSVFGALVGFQTSRDLLLGDTQARALWKYHRASGYVTVILLTLTIFASTKSYWLIQVSGTVAFWILSISPILAAVGLLCLADFRKIFAR